ncbi:putative AsmA family protein YhjG [Rubrivivax sp. A210]|uniref:AsmA family protein n=1 Tax=Rubrivivax sp. A210 TaxID=2772301 RepID=UPI00191A58D7|nr:AsmA family protein [Rubrivivax sp. A210]CAD5365952.1 putative AsmA family protein YhjG [Rubrivivax sp. A210]
MEAQAPATSMLAIDGPGWHGAQTRYPPRGYTACIRSIATLAKSSPALWRLAAALAGLLLLPPLLLLLWSLAFGWNWARAPLQDWALQRSGRVLTIAGDLDLVWAWSLPRVRLQALSFANPPWAATPQMLVAEAADISIDLRQLLQGRLAFPGVSLLRPQLFLEHAADGRKNWLLDRLQSDESVRIPIARLLLDQARIHYLEPARQTAVVLDLSTVSAPNAEAMAEAGTLVFKAEGQFHGQALSASGSGGAVLAWRDTTVPYPLQLQATLGRTRVQAAGSVTGLFALSAVDLQLSLSGDSLATLQPLIGVALPPTPAYRSSGRLLHGGSRWRYEGFAGQIGRSDIAGTLQVDGGGSRPLLTGSLRSRRLELADLGPAVGTGTATPGRVLPDAELNTTAWAQMDADVQVHADDLVREHALPVAALDLRLQLQGRQLRLDPLHFDIAGGRVQASLGLDARQPPLRGRLAARLNGLQPGRLLPTADRRLDALGRVDGDLELQGQGATVAALLASSSGHLRLAAHSGQISRLLMEQTGLHLLEILRLNLSGDQAIALHCAVAEFKVAQGVMQVRTLVLDTEVNTLVGSGVIDLAHEQFDLTLIPRTKVASIVALRSPIRIGGSFASPVLDVDRGRIAARGLGALALGLLNPLLALLPLIETGPGVAGGCDRPHPAPAPPRAEARRP